MSRVAIRIENLGKMYRLGSLAQKSDTLVGEALRAIRFPIDNYRKLRRQWDFSAPDDHDILWALRDVSLEIQQGQAIGIIGRNGAGKSTLLKILSRITEPTKGRVEIVGRIASLLEVGTGFHPDLTGRENIFLNGTMLGMKKWEIDEQLDSIVDFSGVERFLDTPVKRYSSGMRVRLGFAVAAHLRSEILLVDEVLAVGDAAFQAKCLGKMHEITGVGRTILFVSHNLAAISQLCDLVYWLDEGKVAQQGNPVDVIRDYLTKELNTLPVRRWTVVNQAPGDDRVRLMGARLVQAGQIHDIIDINQAVRVELDFVVQQRAINLVSGINLYDENMECLFSSCDWRDNVMKAGNYSKWVEIPAQCLAEGQFTVLVQLVFYDPDIKSVVLKDALRFSAIDSDHVRSVRGKYKGRWPGQMRLALEWSDPIIMD